MPLDTEVHDAGVGDVYLQDVGLRDAAAHADAGFCGTLDVLPDHITMGPGHRRWMLVINRGLTETRVHVRRSTLPEALHFTPVLPGAFLLQPDAQLEIEVDATALPRPWEAQVEVVDDCQTVVVPVQGL